MKLGDIASVLQCRLDGDPEVEISGVAGLQDAGAGELTFLSNPRYAPLVTQTRASALSADRPIEGVRWPSSSRRTRT